MDDPVFPNDLADQIAESLADAFNVTNEDLIGVIMSDDNALLETITITMQDCGFTGDSINGEELRLFFANLDQQDILPMSLADQDMVPYDPQQRFGTQDLISIIRELITRSQKS